MTPGEKVARARTARRPNWSQYELARQLAESSALGIVEVKTWRSRIANYENRASNIDRDALEAIADALGVDPDWLRTPEDSPVRWLRSAANAAMLQNENRPYTGLKLVPYWGVVPCGNWERPDIEDEELIEVSERIESTRNVVAVRVAGNSMLPLFQSGEVVSVRLSSTPLDGVVTLARNQDRELTLKIMRRVDERWELHSLNPDYGVASADNWEILGHAIYREHGDPGGIRP